MKSSNLIKRGTNRLATNHPLTQKLQAIKEEQKQKTQGIGLKLIPERWEDCVNLCTIRSGGRMVQFTPYPYQSLLSELMDQFSNIIIVKSRQLGITQTIISKFLHRASQSVAYSAMAFLRSQEDASAIARRSRQMLDGLKDYVLPDSDSVGYLKLRQLGEIYFKNSSKEGSRSYDSVLDFLFDEAAFSENIEQIYAASSPSGALAGDLITKLIVSTPSAKSGWYWQKLSENNGNDDIEELCKAVAAGELYRDIPGIYWFVDNAGTVKLIIHWKAHPVYSRKENYLQYRQQQDGTDRETVLREYDLRFVDSAISIFSADLVRGNAIGVFENFRDESANYYIGVDTATIGNDYCVAIVIKEVFDIYSVVGIYRKRQQTSEYNLYQIAELIDLYKPEKIGIEVTGGVGQVYLEQLSKQFKGYNLEAIRTTGDSKPVMISTLQLALEKSCLSFPNNSPITDELLTFRRAGNKLEAPSGKHDDCVMALCFALAVSQFNKLQKSIFSGVKLR
jgi:hypothetical protein